MLGRVRRTTGTDVGLAIAFAGISYLVWALVIGVGRHVVNEFSLAAYTGKLDMAGFPMAARWLYNTLMHAAPVFDLVGVLWLILTLALIWGASRQIWSISWAWMSASIGSMVGTLLMIWFALSYMASAPFIFGAKPPAETLPGQLPYPTIGWTPMTVAIAVALVVWTTVLVWLLYEQGRLHRGPTLRDSLGTHVQ
jgi:hypothetical protein